MKDKVYQQTRRLFEELVEDVHLDEE